MKISVLRGAPGKEGLGGPVSERVLEMVLLSVSVVVVVVSTGAETVVFEVGAAEVVTFSELGGRLVDAVTVSFAELNGRPVDAVIVSFAELDGRPIDGVAVTFAEVGGNPIDAVALVSGIVVEFALGEGEPLGGGVEVIFASEVGVSAEVMVSFEGTVVVDVPLTGDGVDSGVGVMMIVVVVVVVLFKPGRVIVVLFVINSVTVVVPDGPVMVSVVRCPPETLREGMVGDGVVVGEIVERDPLPVFELTRTVSVVVVREGLPVIVSVPVVIDVALLGKTTVVVSVLPELVGTVPFVGVTVVRLVNEGNVLPSGIVVLTGGNEELGLAKVATPDVVTGLKLKGGDCEAGRYRGVVTVTVLMPFV